MLLCGVDEPGTSLDKIKLTKNPAHNLKYYKKIVGGLLKFPPSISISCIDQHQNLIAEMFFTHLDNGKDINGIFLTQNVYHWDGTDLYCVQVWSLKDIDLYYINNHWLD